MFSIKCLFCWWPKNIFPIKSCFLEKCLRYILLFKNSVFTVDFLRHNRNTTCIVQSLCWFTSSASLVTKAYWSILIWCTNYYSSAIGAWRYITRKCGVSRITGSPGWLIRWEFRCSRLIRWWIIWRWWSRCANAQLLSCVYHIFLPKLCLKKFD